MRCLILIFTSFQALAESFFAKKIARIAIAAATTVCYTFKMSKGGKLDFFRDEQAGIKSA
jgi:hypothetical protein